MKGTWPSNATDEECSMRLFKDALMGHAANAAVLSAEDEEHNRRAAARVEGAYSRVREYLPEELEGDAAPTYAEVLTALRDKGKGLEASLPPRRILTHMLAGLDYYFFSLPRLGYVYDAPHLTDEERAAEHGLRHDLLIGLYDELEPAFDVSLNWPPNGYDVDEHGDLVRFEAEFEGSAAIGYDYGYDEEYVRGFVEGCLERLLDRGQFDKSDYLRGLWEDGDEKDKQFALRQFKAGCEVREGRYDDRPDFPV